MSVAQEIKQANYNGFTQGVAYCIALYLNLYKEHPWIEEAWKAAGMTLEECEKVVAGYDMSILNEYKQYLENIKK